MKKIKLTEEDLNRIIQKVIKEQPSGSENLYTGPKKVLGNLGFKCETNNPKYTGELICNRNKGKQSQFNMGPNGEFSMGVEGRGRKFGSDKYTGGDFTPLLLRLYDSFL